MTGRRLIGYHVITGHVANWPLLLHQVGRLDAALHVLHMDAPDHFEKFVKPFQSAAPGALIVVRPWHSQERFYHYPHSDPNQRFVASPRDVLGKWGHLGREGRVLELLCDVDGSQHIDRLADWCAEVIDLATKAGITLALPSFATGNPPLPNESAWTTGHDRLLKILSAARERHYVSVHEYLPLAPWRVGRFALWLNARCDKLGIPAPRVLVTEYGFDAGADDKTHWRSRGLNLTQYAATLSRFAQEQYLPAANVVGAAVYTVGRLVPREEFSVESEGLDAAANRHPFFDTLMDTAPRRTPEPVVPEPVKPVDPPTEPTKPVKPEVQWPTGAKIGRTLTVPGETILYASPALNAADVVGKLRAGEMVTRLEDARELAGNRWMYPVLRWAAPAGESYRGWALLNTGQTGTLTQQPAPYELRVTVEITPDQAPLIEQVVPMLMEHLTIKVVPVKP
jgi:hypothetical protein